VSHVGVYFYDLRNILEFTLRFLFYLSPIMWSLEGRDIPFEFLLKANPMYIIISSLRDALIYGRHPDYLSLLWILIASVILIIIGYKMISKNEDEYARVI
jgi:ABC-type polysaccharide/polyol phosphate export permease